MYSEEWKMVVAFFICLTICVLAISSLMYCHSIKTTNEYIKGGYEQVSEPNTYKTVWKKGAKRGNFRTN